MSKKCTIKLTKNEARRLRFMLDFIACEAACVAARKEVERAKEYVRIRKNNRNLK